MPKASNMITTVAPQGQTGAQMPTTNISSGSTSNASGSAYAMSPKDFISLMVTQLENQDPTNPTSSDQLLTQMSQIGQLESSTSLQSTMASVTLQTQVGSASSLIGKTVKGIDSSNASATGKVNSVSITNNSVNLNLDNGSTVPITNLSSINA